MKEITRLSVNLNQETAIELRSLVASAGNATEAVRRSISIYKFLLGGIAAGRRIHITDQDGKNVQELVMM